MPVTYAGMESHHFNNPLVSNTPIIIRKITKPINKRIHKGDVTHHQDHEIWPKSLRTKNTMKVAPKIPIPPVEELVTFFDIISPQNKNLPVKPLERRHHVCSRSGEVIFRIEYSAFHCATPLLFLFVGILHYYYRHFKIIYRENNYIKDIAYYKFY